MEIRAYRLIKKERIKTALDGEGARRFGGRWNSIGIPMVYTSDSVALATLEIFVHLPSYHLLSEYYYIRLSFDSNLVMDAKLKKGWEARPVSKVSQSIGDQWIKKMQTPVLKVPSVIVPDGGNYLININHPDYGQIITQEAKPLKFDPRLKK